MTEAAPESPPPAKRVLIVDSDPLIRAEMSEALAAAGFTVTQAADTVTGVAEIVRSRPDLLLLEMNVAEDLDGVNLCRKLKAHSELKAIPVIFVSAERDRARIVSAMQSGAADFILKSSYTRNLLVAKLRNALGLPAEPAPAMAAVVASEKKDARKSSPRPPPGEIRKSIRAALEIRTLPQVASEVLRITRSPGVDARTLRTAVESDAALSSKILRIANSAYYRRAGPVHTLERAIMTLGFHGICQIVLSVSAINQLKGKENQLDRARLWRHSLYTAIVGRALGAVLNRDFAEEVFVGGLLHDLGKAMLDDLYPELHQEAYQKAVESRSPLCDQETEVFGLNHAQVGKLAGNSWNLPEEIVDMMALHHTPWEEVQKVARETARHVALCQAANVLAKARGFGLGATDLLERLPEDVPPLATMTPADLLRVLAEGLDDLQELESTLFPSVAQALPPLTRPTAPAVRKALIVAEKPGWRAPLAAAVAGQGAFQPCQAATVQEGWEVFRPDAVILGPGWPGFLEAGLAHLTGTGGAPALVISVAVPSEDFQQQVAPTGAELEWLPLPVTHLVNWLQRASERLGPAPAADPAPESRKEGSV